MKRNLILLFLCLTTSLVCFSKELPKKNESRTEEPIVLSGSWYEIGYKYGKIIGETVDNTRAIKEIINYYQQQCDISDKEMANITQIAKKDYEKYIPWYIDYLEGLAKGGNCDKNDVLTWGLASWRLYLISAYKKRGKEDMLPSEWLSKCSCVLADKKSTVNKKAILGHNMETTSWLWDSPGRFVVMKPDEGHSIAFYSKFFDHGCMGHSTVMNDAGLSVALVGLNFVRDLGKGIVPLQIKLALECSTVNEAIEVIKNTPMATPMIINIADSNGNVAAVERGSKLFGVNEPGKKGYLFTARRAMSQELKKRQYLPARTEAFLRYRSKFATEVLEKNKGKIDKNIVEDILTAVQGDIKYGVQAKVPIWTHRDRTKKYKHGVLISSILLPSELKYFYVLENPYPGQYKELRLNELFGKSQRDSRD